MSAYALSPKSLTVRSQLHPDLQALIDELIKHVDFSVTEGYRSPEDQDAAFARGASRARAGQSKHNTSPAQAVHLVPYPPPKRKDGMSDAQWAAAEWREYAYFAGAVNLCASMLGIKLRWGGDWNDNWRTADNSFNDLAHYELLAG